jgi:hypothetical protein
MIKTLLGNPLKKERGNRLKGFTSKKRRMISMSEIWDTDTALATFEISYIPAYLQVILYRRNMENTISFTKRKSGSTRRIINRYLSLRWKSNLNRKDRKSETHMSKISIRKKKQNLFLWVG